MCFGRFEGDLQKYSKSPKITRLAQFDQKTHYFENALYAPGGGGHTSVRGGNSHFMQNAQSESCPLSFFSKLLLFPKI